MLFLTFGLDKFVRPSVIHQQVADSALLPSWLVPIFAGAIGFCEVGLGALFVLGFLVRPASFVAVLALISYTFYLGVAARYPTFGFNQFGVVDRNVPLIFMCAALVFLGAGSWSVDASLARLRTRRGLGYIPDEMAQTTPG